MKTAYTEKRFSPASQEIIDHVNEIVAYYQSLGLTLTLRQTYYQLVSKALIPNTEQSYKRVGNIVNDGRLGGRIDWNAIEDRTRNLVQNSHWNDPAAIVDAAARSYAIDKWENQPYAVEVWVEKEALASIVGQVARAEDVAYFACRGYVSQSEMESAARTRFAQYSQVEQKPVVIHLGDHDPSGIDMTRDLEDRLNLFARYWGGGPVTLDRIALNFDQITQYQPPPNPAKTTDSRFAAYEARFGNESWELDALDPQVLAALIRDRIRHYRDDALYAERRQQEASEKVHLKLCTAHWPEIADDLEERYEDEYEREMRNAEADKQ